MAELVCGRPAKRAHSRWDNAETVVLIETWASIYKHRCDGEIGPWVPEARLRRVRTDRRLVIEDWCAVASAVNAFRDGARLDSHCTPQQCKGHVDTILGIYGKELYGTVPSSWRFFSVLRDVLSPIEPEQRQGEVADGAMGVKAEIGGTNTEDARTMVEPIEDVPDVARDKEGVRDAQGAGTVVEPVQQESEGINGGEPGRGGAPWSRRSASVMGLVGAAVDAPHIPKKPRSAAGWASGPAGRGMRGRASAGYARHVAAVKKVTADMYQNVTDMCQNMCQDLTRICQDMVVESLDAERGLARAPGAARRRRP
ncbi:unnamed protein product [Urochloa humidicola]